MSKPNNNPEKRVNCKICEFSKTKILKSCNDVIVKDVTDLYN